MICKITPHFCRKYSRNAEDDTRANGNYWVRLCKLKKMCCVRSDPRPRLTPVGVTAECHRDSRVLGGPIILPLLHCLSSSLSFILKNYFFPSLSTSCPPSPSQAPRRPLTRTLCLSAKWAAFLAVADHWDRPGLPLWSDG